MEKPPPSAPKPSTFILEAFGQKYEATFTGDNIGAAQTCAKNALKALDIARKEQRAGKQGGGFLQDVTFIKKITTKGITFETKQGEMTFTYEGLDQLLKEETATKIAAQPELQDVFKDSASDIKGKTFRSITKVWRESTLANPALTPAEAKLQKLGITSVNKTGVAEIVPAIQKIVAQMTQEIASLTTQLVKASLSKDFALVNQLKVKLLKAKNELNQYLQKKDGQQYHKRELLNNGSLAKSQIDAYRKEFNATFKGTLESKDQLGKVLSEKVIINEIFDRLSEEENKAHLGIVQGPQQPLCTFSSRQETALKESPKVLKNCLAFVDELMKQEEINEKSLLFKSVAASDPFLLGKAIKDKVLIEKDFLGELDTACNALKASELEDEQQVGVWFDEVNKLQAQVVKLSIPGDPKDKNYTASEVTRKENLTQAIQGYNEAVEKFQLRIGDSKSLNVAKLKDALLLGIQIHGKNEYLRAQDGKSPDQQKFIQYQVDRFALQITNQLAFHGYKIQGYDVAEIRKGLEETTKATNDFDQIVEKVGLAAIAEKMGALLEAIKDGVLAIRNFLYECIFPGHVVKEILERFESEMNQFEASIKEPVKKIIQDELSLDPKKIQGARGNEQKLVDQGVMRLLKLDNNTDKATLRKLVQAEIDMAKMEALIKLAAIAPPKERERYLGLHDELEKKVLPVKAEFSKRTGNTGKVGREEQQSQMNEQSIQSVVLRAYYTQSKPTRAIAEKAFNEQIEHLTQRQANKDIDWVSPPATAKNPNQYIKTQKEGITKQAEEGKATLLTDLEKASKELKKLDPNSDPSAIQTACAKFEAEYNKIADAYSNAKGGGLTVTQPISRAAAKARTIEILEDLMKKNADNEKPVGSLIAVRDNYQTLSSSSQKLAVFSGPEKIQNIVAKCVSQVVPDVINNLEAIFTTTNPPKSENQIRNEVSQSVKESLGELGITNAAFIEDVTMLIIFTAQLKAYDASKAVNKKTIEKPMSMMAGTANQIQSSLTEARVKEVTGAPLPKARPETANEKALESKRLANEEQELKTKNDDAAKQAKLEKIKRAVNLSSNDPLYALQREAMFGVIGDLVKFTQKVHDVTFRHGEFVTFDAFEQEFLRTHKGIEGLSKLVSETKITTKKRAEKFAEYHKGIEDYKPEVANANEQFNKLRKLQVELAQLDHDEANLEKRWASVNGIQNPQDYFEVFREHSGMHIGSIKKDALMQNRYVQKTNSHFKNKNDFSNVRNNEVKLSAPNLDQMEANFNKVSDAIKMGISLSDKANALSVAISPKPDEMTAAPNLAKDLNHVLTNQLSHLDDLSSKKIPVKQSISDQIAKESKEYEKNIANFITGAAQPINLHSQVAEKIGESLNTNESTKNLGQSEKNQIAKGIQVTVLLEQLSTAQAVVTNNNEAAQRKAIVVNSLIDRLSTALNTLEHLNPGTDIADTRRTVMLKNLSAQKVAMPTNGNSIDGINQALIEVQFNKASGIDPKTGLDDLIAKAKAAVGEAGDVTKASAQGELKKVTDVIDEIRTSGMDIDKYDRLQNQLAVINDKIKDPKNGALFALQLMSALIAKNDPLLNPLLDKISNNLGRQLPKGFSDDFVELSLDTPASVDKNVPQNQKVLLANEQIGKVLKADPDMKLSANDYKSVTRDEKSKELEGLLTKYLKTSPPQSKAQKSLLDAIAGGAPTTLSQLYDERFEKMKKHPDNPIKAALAGRTDTTEAEQGVNDNPVVAIYYWTKKANACANTPDGILDKEICYREITRLLRKLPPKEQSLAKIWQGDNAPFFSEHK